MRLPSLYAITDRSVSGIDNHAEIAGRLYRAGARLVQVREKEMPDATLLAQVEGAAAEALRHGALLLVNDRTDIARIAAVGVHLGEEDLPPADARALLGAEATIGVSTHDFEAARAAFAETSSDYVAFGPVFPSGSKGGREARGVGELARVAAARSKPLVAIGGITAETLDAVFDAGADSAAMIGGLLAGGRIEENARRALDRARRRELTGRIYLIGFMGSGKTAVGARLAERLDVPFVDLDAEIERTSGVTIRALFESSGEAAFREREALFLRATESLPRAVVATGGGCFVREENRARILRLGTPVFLDVPFEAIRVRLAGKTDRPLFAGVEQAAALFAERAPLYRIGAVRVELSGWEEVEEAVDRVLNALSDARENPPIL